MSAIKKFLRPNVVIPLLLVGGLVAALLSLTDIGKVLALMVSIPAIDLLVFLALMVAYEVVRGVQWIVLLRALRLKSPLRTELFAFSVSEVTKALPIGNYVQNYLLQESEQHEDFARTSAATTLIIVLEVCVSLLGVLILGDGSWTLALRIIIVVGAALAALAAWLGLRFGRRHDPPEWAQKRKFVRTAMEKLRNFADGVRDLLHPRTLALATGLSALYLVIASTGLYVITQGLQFHVTFTQTLSVYMLSLAINLIVPLPVDIGVLEISMLGAFAAVGVSRNDGLGASLLNRLLSIGASLVIAIVALTVLNRELRAALRSGRRRRARQGTKDEQSQRVRQEEHIPLIPATAVTLVSALPHAGSPAPPLADPRQTTSTAPERRATLTVVGVALAVVVGLAFALQVIAQVVIRRRARVPVFH